MTVDETPEPRKTAATPRKRAPRKTAAATPRKRAPRKVAEEPVAAVEGDVIDASGEPINGDTPTVLRTDVPDDPIPGMTLEDIGKIIDDARRVPDTADIIIDGVRGLIEANGYDPDTIIAAATQTGHDGLQDTDESDINASALSNAMVEFHGRLIEVTAPGVEQIMVIRRLQSVFASAAKMETIKIDEASRLMDRALKAVCSVIVRPDDVEYIEDLLLDRTATMEDTLPLLQRSLKALEEVNATSGNRASRRKAAKSAGRVGGASLATS